MPCTQPRNCCTELDALAANGRRWRRMGAISSFREICGCSRKRGGTASSPCHDGALGNNHGRLIKYERSVAPRGWLLAGRMQSACKGSQCRLVKLCPSPIGRRRGGNQVSGKRDRDGGYAPFGRACPSSCCISDMQCHEASA